MVKVSSSVEILYKVSERKFILGIIGWILLKWWVMKFLLDKEVSDERKDLSEWEKVEWLIDWKSLRFWSMIIEEVVE